MLFLYTYFLTWIMGDIGNHFNNDLYELLDYLLDELVLIFCELMLRYVCNTVHCNHTYQ